jgi:hypothetical protein
MLRPKSFEGVVTIIEKNNRDRTLGSYNNVHKQLKGDKSKIHSFG